MSRPAQRPEKAQRPERSASPEPAEAKRRRACGFLDALPASVEIPAGAGKTHLLVDAVRELATRNHRDHRDDPEGRKRRGDRSGRPTVLVLTHTNAGVQAIRRRLGPELAQNTHVSTISSFAFEFARAYPRLGGTPIPAHPDWEHSAAYLRAAVRVCGNRHVQAVLGASFTHVFVDEYQDCSGLQHELVLLLRRAVPATGVLGDPLQAIFGFDRALPLADWAQVRREFPDHAVEHRPWRWQEHNPALGDWLLELRDQLVPGATLDLSDRATPDGVRFRFQTPDGSALRQELYRHQPMDGSVLVVTGIAAAQSRKTAARAAPLGYTTMEDINGAFMRARLAELATTPPQRFATWVAELAIMCFAEFPKAKLDKTVMSRLAKGQSPLGLHRPALTATLPALDALLRQPTLSVLAATMHTIARSGEAYLHSPEAWNDIASAIRAAATVTPAPASPEDLHAELLAGLGHARDRLRHLGRSERHRQVSRTVLVKGLEYDHVIIAGVGDLTDACNLYVALTRARRGLTIIGSNPKLTVTGTRGVHR